MSTLRVDVAPAMLRWAVDRSGRSVDAVLRHFDKFGDWLNGEAKPTLRQLEAFAKYTYTPIGQLFLDSPPRIALPVADFRSVSGRADLSPSVHLMDVIHSCEIRQDWYRRHLIGDGADKLSFVGSESMDSPAERVAATIADQIDFSVDARAKLRNFDVALRDMVERVEAIGILVMRNGVVDSNTQRPLDPKEFSGFALADDYAPLIFLNGKDTKARQTFTLAHELAHVWLGKSGVSLSTINRTHDERVERWCDSVAAELLVPMAELKRLASQASAASSVDDLGKHFKVSSLVVLRRLRDAEYLSQDDFSSLFRAALLAFQSKAARGGGGNFYHMQLSRTGKRFTRAVIASTVEGQTLYRDACQMLGVKKPTTLNELAHQLGVPT